MQKRTSLGTLAAAFSLSVAVGAQSVRTDIETLEDCVRAKEWPEAFDLLRGLADRIVLDADRERFAAAVFAFGDALGQSQRRHDALQAHELALRHRLLVHGDSDHAAVANSLNAVGICLSALGRSEEALPRYEQALAMRKRLSGDGDHLAVANSLNNAGVCLLALGRADDALSMQEAALAMRRRLHGGDDHPEVAQSLHNVAACLQSAGRAAEALPLTEASLAICTRLCGESDHPDVAWASHSVAACLRTLGRPADALPRFEATLAMRRRLCGDRDDPDVAESLNSIGLCFDALGRADEALSRHEAALVMRKRLYGNHDHPEVAESLNNVGLCLQSLGRAADALPHLEAALEMRKHLHGDREPRSVAAVRNNVALCLQSLGREAEALASYQAALATLRRLHADRDHPDVAQGISNVAVCLHALGRGEDALPAFEASLAMLRHLYGDRDHPDVVRSMCGLAACLQGFGRNDEAAQLLQRACDTIERLRASACLSPALRRSFFDEMKRDHAYEWAQRLTAPGDAEGALSFAERSRGRDLLDVFEQQRVDPLTAVRREAAASADTIARLAADLAAAALESDRALHLLLQLDDAKLGEAERAVRRKQLLAQSDAAAQRQRQLLDERARVLSGSLPVGRVCDAAAIATALRQNELLLEFTVARDVALLYVLGPEGHVAALQLPDAFRATQSVLPAVLAGAAHDGLRPRRGRDPGPAANADVVAAARELFSSLIPPSAWERIRSARRVFVAAHRDLHRLPFEVLVVGTKEGQPVHWLDAGPPIAYVPSGSALHWLRDREPAGATAAIDLVAIGDPALGVEASTLGPGDGASRFVHHEDLERLRKLPSLRGARAEAEAIVAAVREKRGRAELRLGAEATETAVFDLAAKAKHLHFACHGIAEEYAGQSLSMLALAQPKDVVPGDDGFLKLDDLFHSWCGRLDGCRLVVLSACRTDVGPTHRDDAPQALPIGFLFAGASAVISSLWAVDDESTRVLMTDFYGRLLAGETDQLAAFTAAKKALRAKFGDPFHWAPFLYVGCPD